MTRRGWVLFAAMGILWGIPYLMIKVAVAEVSVPFLVFSRTLVGGVALLALALRGGRLRALKNLTGTQWRALLAFAAVEIIVPWWLLSDAERILTSSLTGLLLAGSPVIAVLSARLLGDAERLRPLRIVGLALGFAGVAVLAGPELAGGSPFAIGEVLLTSLCYATGPQIAARWLRDVPSLPMTGLCLGLAAVLYAAPAIVTWPSEMPSAQALWAIVGLALVCTALAFVVFFALIREVGGARALVFTYVNPAVAVTAGVLLLGEPLTVPILAAFVLILGGSVLATTRTVAREPAVSTG